MSPNAGKHRLRTKLQLYRNALEKWTPNWAISKVLLRPTHWNDKSTHEFWVIMTTSARCHVHAVINIFYITVFFLCSIQTSEKFWRFSDVFSGYRIENTAWKVSKYGIFSGPYFPVFGLNTEKYGPEKSRIWSEDEWRPVVWNGLRADLCQNLSTASKPI